MKTKLFPVLALLGLPLLAAWPRPAAAQDATCPGLPSGAGLHWEQQAGNGFSVCRALDAAGRQVIGVMLTGQPTVNLRRRYREEQGTVGAYEVHWYRPELAVDTGEKKRVTVVELGGGRYAQIWVDAGSEEELQNALGLARGLALN